VSSIAFREAGWTSALGCGIWGGLFDLEDLGPKSLKGFAEPLTAWRVEGEGQAEGRFEAAADGGLDAAGRP
jgi:hypothetical protein